MHQSPRCSSSSDGTPALQPDVGCTTKDRQQAQLLVDVRTLLVVLCHITSLPAVIPFTTSSKAGLSEDRMHSAHSTVAYISAEWC